MSELTDKIKRLREEFEVRRKVLDAQLPESADEAIRKFGATAGELAVANHIQKQVNDVTADGS